MADTRPPSTAPAPLSRAPSSDFSAGASSPPQPPRRPRSRTRRALRGLGWLLAALVALLITAAAALWWWAGSNTSLATALARAAQYLPAGQQLESRDVTGSLRGGGRIGWLRWSSPALAVEVNDIALGWQLMPLLHRRLELGEVHAARVQITPAADAPPSTAPREPLTQLRLPLQIGVPFRVDTIEWAGPQKVQVLGLQGDYRFDGREHRLKIDHVELAQGRYTAQATLQADAPMTLTALVDGTVQANVPGGSTPLPLDAHATLQGTLATAAAQLELKARISPAAASAASPAAATASGASAASDAASAAPSPTSKAASKAAAPPARAASSRQRDATPPPPSAEPMQADLVATLTPWASQPLQAATATLHAVDLAALWPQAPRTLLSGTVQAGPGATAAAAGTPQAPLSGSPATPPATAANPPASPSTGWALQAELKNDLAGPWDLGRLPLSALQAQARYDGTRWSVPSAVATAGLGTATLQGHFTPATQAVEGEAQLRNLRPDLLHTAMAAVPLAGRISAQTQGDRVRFNADIRATGPAATPAHAPAAKGSPGLLSIQTLAAQGSWQPPAANSPPGGGTVQLERLLLDALQARAEATDLRIALAGPAVQGRVAVTVPGATARAQGGIAPASGAGDLQLQWADAEATQRWLASLPWVGGTAQAALQGASAKGTASLTARWKGGWQMLTRQLQAASSSGGALPTGKDAFELQATLATPQFDLALPPSKDAGSRPLAVQLRGVKAELSGNVLQAALSVDGEARLNASQAQQMQRVSLQARLSGGLAAPSQWRAQISELRVQAQDAQRPGPWSLQLAEPLSVTVNTASRTGSTPAPASAVTVQASAGQARLTGPEPGAVVLRWQPARVTTGAALQLQTQGTLQGLPMAWVDALGIGGTPAAAGRPMQPLLARMGLASTLVLDGQWNVDTSSTLRASASLRRASGDLRILAGDPTAVTAVQSSGQGAGAGATTVIATEATSTPAAGTPAGVRQAEVSFEVEGDALRARLAWASERAGEIDATASTRLTLGNSSTGSGAGGTDLAAITWAANAPLAGSLRARLPDVGVWSALAPPGWRVRGTLDTSATLSGTRDVPRWAGTLGADNLAVRSVVDGVDLQGGRLRAALNGNQLDITEFRLQGGRSSGARIAGFSGNRTAAPQDGGTLTGTGRITWGQASTGMSGIAMSMQAEAKALQVLVRADRQISVSGQLQAQLQQGQISLRGKLTTDRATIILPDESAPSLGSDVVVRSAAKDKEDQAKAQAAARANQVSAQAETPKPPDIAITLNLGRDFALHGHGITTRLTGEVDIRSSAVAGAPPRVTGEVRTEEGRYRAWGQMLDVETGLIRFNGPYNNPSLDILALRPNISVRAGVQVTGSAQAPRVRLYSDPELPDAEKLSWVVLGRNAAAGGAEAAMLQQAALALLGRGGNNSNGAAGNVARRLGLDEIGFKGAGAGEDATGAALTFGKRISRKLYLTYERSLSGTLGTLYIFYDLSRRLTLRGQTGEKSAVDIIYTVKYD